MEASKVFDVILSAMPYPDQINGVEFLDDKAVEFSWRGTKYRVDENLHVEEVEGCFLKGTDKSILLRSLLKKTKLIRGE